MQVVAHVGNTIQVVSPCLTQVQKNITCLPLSHSSTKKYNLSPPVSLKYNRIQLVSPCPTQVQQDTTCLPLSHPSTTGDKLSSLPSSLLLWTLHKSFSYCSIIAFFSFSVIVELLTRICRLLLWLVTLASMVSAAACLLSLFCSANSLLLAKRFSKAYSNRFNSVMKFFIIF